MEAKIRESAVELEKALAAKLSLEVSLKKDISDRDKLLSEVHERVANNLQMLASLLNIQAGNVDDRHTRKLLNDNQERINSVVLVHETLHQINDYRRVPLSTYLDALVSDIYRNHVPENLKIRLQKSFEDIEVDIEKAVPIGLIVTELLKNALQHAYFGKTTGSGRIEFKLYKSSGECVFLISDDGCGIPDNFIAESEAMGIKIATILTEQLDGMFKKVGGPGTTLEIRFPLGGM